MRTAMACGCQPRARWSGQHDLHHCYDHNFIATGRLSAGRPAAMVRHKISKGKPMRLHLTAAMCAAIPIGACTSQQPPLDSNQGCGYVYSLRSCEGQTNDQSPKTEKAQQTGISFFEGSKPDDDTGAPGDTGSPGSEPDTETGPGGDNGQNPGGIHKPKKPKSDSSDSNGKGGNKHGRPDKGVSQANKRHPA